MEWKLGSFTLAQTCKLVTLCILYIAHVYIAIANATQMLMPKLLIIMRYPCTFCLYRSRHLHALLPCSLWGATVQYCMNIIMHDSRVHRTHHNHTHGHGQGVDNCVDYIYLSLSVLL